jgi:hypothetical protein
MDGLSRRTIVAELTDDGWNELARDLTSRVAAFSPEWTDRAEGDPGVTIVELFGFLAESILGRADASSAGRARLLQVIERLERAHAAPCPDRTLTRNRFFAGRILTADDLEREQEYHRTKHRRHNRLLHGYGIVEGLEVTVESSASGGTTVTVSPGFAIDRNGEELLICERATSNPCPGKADCYVTIRLVERAADETPDGESSRIDESAEIAVVDEVPPDHLAIARLARTGDIWQLDVTFAPARVAV